MNELLLPFQFAFMRDAFIITIMLAVPAALLSCFLVLKGWSLMGDAISHAVLPGVVIAYVIGIPLVIGAFVAGMSCALLRSKATCIWTISSLATCWAWVPQTFGSPE